MGQVTSTAPATRFARLAYTSSDTVPGAAPGWGAKESDGDLTARELAEITGRTPQLVAWDCEVPQTAGASAKALLPRRLAHEVLPGVGSCLFHTTPAGTDDSGRPGNTYTQVVLDRCPRTPGDPFRPTDVWRSPQWAIPFSKFEVGGARLGPWQRPAAGPLSNAGAVVQFVLDAANPLRVFALPGILDIVFGALMGGPMAVLGVEDPDEGAAWLATVLRLLSPRTARHVGLSTFERATTLAAAVEAGLRIVCVPRSDLAAVEGPVAAIDTHSEQELDADRSAHIAAGGVRIPVTDFSRVASAVMDDEEVALRLFALVDDWSARLGDHDYRADLPLALAFLDYTGKLADAGDEFAEARIAAARIIVGSGTAVGADLAQRAARLVLSDVTALRMTQRPYACAADDPSVLGDAGVRSVLDAVLVRRGRGEAAAAADVLRFFDLVTVLGAMPMPAARPAPGTRARDVADVDANAAARGGTRKSGGAPSVADRLLREVEKIFDGYLLPHGGDGALIAAVGPLGMRTQQRLRSILESRAEECRAQARRPAGDRISGLVLDWVFSEPVADADCSLEDAVQEYQGVDALTAERVAHRSAMAPGGLVRRRLAVDLAETPWFPLTLEDVLHRVPGLDEDEVRLVESLIGHSASPPVFEPPAWDAPSAPPPAALAPPTAPVPVVAAPTPARIPAVPKVPEPAAPTSPSPGLPLEGYEALLNLARLVPSDYWTNGIVDPETRLVVQAAWLVAVVGGDRRIAPPGVTRVPAGDPARTLALALRSVSGEALVGAAFLAAGGAGPQVAVPEAVTALGGLSVGNTFVLAAFVQHGFPAAVERAAVLDHVRRLLGAQHDPGPALDERFDTWLFATVRPVIAHQQGDSQ